MGKGGSPSGLSTFEWCVNHTVRLCFVINYCIASIGGLATGGLKSEGISWIPGLEADVSHSNPEANSTSLHAPKQQG